MKWGCGLGWLSACTHLGLLFQEGHGVVRDKTHGHALLQDACTRGDSAACQYLKAP
jgi:TPR repeat protein